MRIAIVGAGPAGLMLALSLVRHRSGKASKLDLTLFEREQHHDRQPRANADRSYTIDITGHGRKAIASIGPGLLDRFDRELIPFRGIEAHVLGRTLPYAEGGWTGSRGDICSTLLHELESILPSGNVNCSFLWDTEVTGVSADDGSLSYRTGGESRSSRFDLVVGADGAGSFFRRQLEADGHLRTQKHSIPNYSRILHLDQQRPDAAFDPALLHMFSLRPWAVGGAILDADAAHQAEEVVAAELPKDFYVQMGYWDDAPVGKPGDVAAMLRKIRVQRRDKEERAQLADFVSAAEVEAYSQRDVYHTGKTVVCSQLIGGRCVLLGDAGTAFPPVGQGVNAALEAATVLGERLARAEDPDIQAAIHDYNQTWLPQARACSVIANQVVYGSKLNMLRMLVLSALSEITGIEFVGPQMAKDANYSYSKALMITRRRERLLYLGLVLAVGAAAFLLT